MTASAALPVEPVAIASPGDTASASAPAWLRAILFVACEDFAAHAEAVRKPALASVPLAVTGLGGERGTVMSVSALARTAGVRHGMPLIEAQRRCPSLVILPHDGAYYDALSQRLLDLLHAIVPDVRAVGAGAAILDCTGRAEAPDVTAARVCRSVQETLGLSVSVGVATGQTVAQIAAHFAVPDGVRVIPSGTEAGFLAPLPVAALPGIGPTTRRALAALRIETLGQLAARDTRTLYKAFGERGLTLARQARGLDEDAPEIAGRVIKAIGHTRTLAKPTKEIDVLHATLAALCDDTAAELRRQGLTTRQITLRVRRADYRSTTLRRIITPGTDAGQRLLAVVAGMLGPCLRELNHGRVRQLQVCVTKLSDGGRQLPLWDSREDEQFRTVNATLDALRTRYGKAAVRPAATLRAAPEAPPDAVFMP